MTQVSGKLVDIEIYEEGKKLLKGIEATIELPEVNLEDMKEGDEVWVKCKNIRVGNGLIKDDNDIAFWKRDIIAHFPQQSKAEPKKEIEKLKCQDTIDQTVYKLVDKINEIIFYLNRQ